MRLKLTVRAPHIEYNHCGVLRAQPAA